MATKRRVSALLDRIAYTNDSFESSSLLGHPRDPLSNELPLSYQFYERKKREELKKRADNLQLASYAPWSRDAFLQRLETYTYKNWDVPSGLESINPVECAKAGWSASVKNRLTCVSCSKSFTVIVGDSPAVQHKMEARYCAMLVDEHAESCQWRKRGSPSNIYGLVMVRSVQAAALKRRYDSLLKYAELLTGLDFVPSLDEVPMWDAVLSVKMGIDMDGPNGTRLLCQEPRIATSPQDTPTRSRASHSEAESSTTTLGQESPDELQTPQRRVEPPSYSKSALTLAIIGWKAASKQVDPVRVLVTCELCFRRTFACSGLDLNESHHSYCPYVSTSDTSGWKSIYKLLLRTSAVASRQATPTPQSTPLKPLDEEERDYHSARKAHMKRLLSLRSLYFKN
jgi:hypothetical protein